MATMLSTLGKPVSLPPAELRSTVQAQRNAVEAQLASTTAELRQMKLQKQQLEELLKQAHISSSQPVLSQVMQVTASAATTSCMTHGPHAMT